MTLPTPATDLSLELHRTFAAPPERVFRAWTEPEAIKRWFSTASYTTVVAEVDLRVGGKYRIGMQSGDGQVVYVSGKYREIVRPTKLVFSWVWAIDPHDEVMVVTVEFVGRGSSTEVILTHERLPNAKSHEQHRRGWEECFDKLARWV